LLKLLLTLYPNSIVMYIPDPLQFETRVFAHVRLGFKCSFEFRQMCRLDIVVRYTRSVKFDDSLKMYERAMIHS
jgi:hypothetical protein